MWERCFNVNGLTMSSCETNRQEISAMMPYWSGISGISGMIWHIGLSILILAQFVNWHFLFVLEITILSFLVWMPKPCGPLLYPSGYQFSAGLYKAFCLALLTLASGNDLFIPLVNPCKWPQPALLYCFKLWLWASQYLFFVSIAKQIYFHRY